VIDVKRSSAMPAAVVAVVAGVGALIAVLVMVQVAVANAKERLTTPEVAKPQVAVAAEAEVAYCTPRFKQVLERVLHSCGLVGAEGGRRGCQPSDVKTFASINDEDFNELFTPLKERGGVVLYDEGKDDLDEKAKKLLEDMWFERKGARYFFVVARASKSGSVDKNRALSHRRANSVMYYLKDASKDREIEKTVGLLWLGNEFAQLSKDYCTWNSSRPDSKCNDDSVNRSAFVSWVDCRL
jgi:outer membrane protein OmpA-like peptidoglycan-associated protein